MANYGGRRSRDPIRISFDSIHTIEGSSSSSSSLNNILDAVNNQTVYSRLETSSGDLDAKASSVAGSTSFLSWNRRLEPTDFVAVLRERLVERYTHLLKSHPINSGPRKLPLPLLAPPLYHNNYSANIHDLSLHSKVLVKGPPSSGKTMLCYKLISDWLESKTGILAYIDLSIATGGLAKTISNGINLKQSQIRSYLNNNKFTLILDGLENVQDKHLMKEIEDVLNGNTFKYCNVIVTSTRGLSLQTYDVKGLSMSSISSIIGKYIPCNRVIEEMAKMDIVRDPYMLLLVIMVYEKCGSVPSKLSKLYMRMCEMLNLVTHFEMMGKLAVKDCTFYNVSDLNKEVRKSGLVIVKGKKFRFINDSFRDFLAACYFKNNPTGNTSTSVLNYIFEMLGDSSYSLIVKLNRYKYSVAEKLQFLKASGHGIRNVDSICNIIDTKHIVINIQSSLISEYKQILQCPNCRLESLELVISPGYPINRIVDGLVLNKSVNSVKISSVPGQDWNELDITLLANQILKLMQNRNIDSLELSFTLLEDKEHLRFQPFVDVICFSIGNLRKLRLDLDLTSDQLRDIVGSIDYIDEIDLLHLGCGYNGFEYVSILVDKCNSLDISGAWRTGFEQVSAGSLQKRSLGTLQRYGSVRTRCNALEHQNGLHMLFTNLKNNTNLKVLNLAKSVMSYTDFICMGEGLRYCSLVKLTLEGMKFADLVQVLLNLSVSSVKELNIGSSHCVLNNDDFLLLTSSVKKLEALSIAGWTVNGDYFEFGDLKELDISFCKFYLKYPSSSCNLEKLVMDSAVVKVNDLVCVNEFIAGCPLLKYLDVTNTGVNHFKCNSNLDTLIIAKNSFRSIKELKLNAGLRKLYLNNAVFSDKKDCHFLSSALSTLEYIGWDGIDTTCICVLKSIKPRSDCVLASDNLKVFVEYFESNCISFEYCEQGLRLKKFERRRLF